MIFASDLDRTLIYSRRSFGPLENLPPICLIEKIGEKEVSFMTETAINQLEKLMQQLCFIPVTTRTVDQYRRISLFQKRLIPRFAVVSNGGYVLIDGIADQAWTRSVQQRVKHDCSPFEDILSRFRELHPNSFLRSPLRFMDDLFYTYRVDPEKLPWDELLSFEQWLKKEGWKLSVQGRKMYLIPKIVNKWSGLAYVREQLGEKLTIAAGDSLLDLDLLLRADYAIAPRHGEIYERLQGKISIPFTGQSGLLASEEILRFVASHLPKHLEEV